MRPLQSLMSTTLALTFLVSWVSRSTAAEVCKQEPKLVSDEQKRISLFLPESVRKTIQADFPDFRAPSHADMKGLWATESEPGSLPYFAHGDFNGDARQDFTLVLAGQKADWFVIFHGSAGCTHLVGYKAGRSLPEEMTLQSVLVRTIPKGEEKVIESTGPGGKGISAVQVRDRCTRMDNCWRKRFPGSLQGSQIRAPRFWQ
ncbi:MAG TPA: hypothetical protein VIX37_02920 [Candidatus Sulfotelmatobacter sp.]